LVQLFGTTFPRRSIADQLVPWPTDLS
jgi:hypothetical protein